MKSNVTNSPVINKKYVKFIDLTASIQLLNFCKCSARINSLVYIADKYINKILI